MVQPQADDGGVGAEIMARHGHSAQPESQQVIAVLQAVEEVIHAQSLQVTPTSYFAAIMSALEKEDTVKSQDVRRAAGLAALVCERGAWLPSRRRPLVSGPPALGSALDRWGGRSVRWVVGTCAFS